MATVYGFAIDNLSLVRPQIGVEAVVHLVKDEDNLLSNHSFGQPGRVMPGALSQKLGPEASAFRKSVKLGNGHF